MNPEIIALIALIGAGVIYVILPKRTNVLDTDSTDPSSWVERREQQEPSSPPTKTQRFKPTPVYTIQEGDNEDEQDGGSRRRKRRQTKRRQTKRRQTDKKKTNKKKTNR